MKKGRPGWVGFSSHYSREGTSPSPASTNYYLLLVMPFYVGFICTYTYLDDFLWLIEIFCTYMLVF